MTVDVDNLRQWIGKQEHRSDLVTRVPLQALSATLDQQADWPDGQPIPPLWHWLFFLPLHRQSMLGSDGHPLRGGFLPPVPLPRRMWAASELVFHQALEVGQSIDRTSTIEDVQLKSGRSGSLVFVKVRHHITSGGLLAIDEVHHIVYRDQPSPLASAAAGEAAPSSPLWSRTVVPDDVLLFRYSALTFNGHRIHYDRRYAIEAEGYPGLVVHGPLLATLLLDLLGEHLPHARVRAFEFRALQPIFDVAPFQICGQHSAEGKVDLWVVTPTGRVAMQARASLA